MQTLRLVGLDEDGGFVVCEDPGGERYRLAADEQLRAASRGDAKRMGQIEIELERQMRPREIQARIRAGESVEHVAHVAGIPVQRVERFAYPVLLERSRTAELAQSAHPVREDGPDVQTLSEIAAYAFGHWGQDFDAVSWDSWRGDDGRWVVQLHWKAGRSENRAHWAFSPGAHGGTVTALDEHAEHVLDPRAGRGPRSVTAPLAHRAPAREPEILARESEPGEQELDATPVPTDDPVLQPPVELVPSAPGQDAAPTEAAEPQETEDPEPVTEEIPATEPPAAAAAGGSGGAGTPGGSGAGKPTGQAKRGKKNRPAVPSWEDVLLGVRSNR